VPGLAGSVSTEAVAGYCQQYQAWQHAHSAGGQNVAEQGGHHRLLLTGGHRTPPPPPLPSPPTAHGTKPEGLQHNAPTRSTHEAPRSQRSHWERSRNHSPPHSPEAVQTPCSPGKGCQVQGGGGGGSQRPDSFSRAGTRGRHGDGGLRIHLHTTPAEHTLPPNNGDTAWQFRAKSGARGQWGSQTGPPPGRSHAEGGSVPPHH
jgi:hypothetical protein